MSKRRRESSTEIINRLAADPEYQAKREARQRLVEEHVRQSRLEQRQLLAELSEVGVDIDSVAELAQRPNDYSAAIDTLVRHLSMDYSTSVLEGIARALTCSDAKGKAGPSLVALFEKTQNQNLRNAVGNALSEVATKDELEDVVRLYGRPEYKEARIMFPHTIVRLAGQSATQTLIAGLADPILRGETLEALGKLPSAESLAAVAEHLDDPVAWRRRKARKAHERIVRRMS